MHTFAEYIWIDGTTPVQRLRSKSKVINALGDRRHVDDIPAWNFDGSSTNQAEGHNSERILKPVSLKNDPLREGCFLILCEVMNPDGSPHESNKRAQLRDTVENGGAELESWWGFEQEYCLMDNKTDAMLGWPASQKHYPKPQGMFYCGVGCDEVVGREIVHEHAKACLDAGLLIYGHNAEVMLGQWEFQIGHRGFVGDPTANPLIVSDHLWLARYLLYRIGEKHGVYATLKPKPKDGDWNGSGKHTNYSDKFTRSKKTGNDRIEDIRVAMEKMHLAHQVVYGHDNKSRLTGKHETAPFEKFTMGTADRGASIRVPNGTKEKGCGYIEDRRPAANADPYVVTNRFLQTVLKIGE